MKPQALLKLKPLLIVVLLVTPLIATASETVKPAEKVVEFQSSGETEAFEMLSEFLMNINSHLAETATRGDYTDSDFRSWAAAKYGSVRAFRSQCRELQMTFENIAEKIGTNLRSTDGVGRVIDHILGDKNSRLEQIAVSEGQERLKECYEEFIRNHQSCLQTAVSDGLFEYQDWHSGAQLMNCVSQSVRDFNDCAGL
ncbi:MAG: hypothetical protein EA411_10060 [Saprospirales bacterium]|nr:MAG: hypothetical protein EA411_10060 [Saprospirales bacterium]